MAFFVYILVSKIDGTLYTGQSANLRERLERHNTKSVSSTKAKAPFEIGYFETFQSRSEAMWREWELKKKFNTDRKRKLVASFDRSKIIDLLGL